MRVSISPLELDGFDRLPLHNRRCVFWEVDPDGGTDTLDAALTGSPGGYESEFDKEAWVSGLMLEWGTCCQVAVEESTGRIVGTAFYAPPGRVPRAKRFPTAPVSPDAILLTAIGTEPGFEDYRAALLDAVVADVIGRGARAVEAFGLTATDSGLAGDLVSLLLGGGAADNVCRQCLMDTGLLAEAGFEVIAPDQYLPRLRLDLNQGLGWKSQVERALEKLLISETVALQGVSRPMVPAHARRGSSG
ncbi:MAG: hypothetical protein QM774_11410 [Gordonia sp. (in: high G+C Gram-positive bacteria)]|uniref:hypothetical protein n=1 Tax=Gordonia sp. (in: high G+C Gram-positive bacteria) TaxID=84139 RepID=UPI0039E6BB7E